MTGLACAIYGGALGVRSAVSERRFPLRLALTLSAGVLLGFALAAPQLLPAFELLGRSTRALGSLTEIEVGTHLSSHDPGVFFRRLFQEGGNSAVPGLPALALVVLALARPVRDRLRPWALFAVAAVTLAISFPEQLPVYGWLRQLPVFDSFRFPFRYRPSPC